MAKKINMVIWLKISDAFGYVGVSKGETMEDIDKHIPKKDIDKILGFGSNERLLKLNGIANYLTEETSKFMLSKGWIEKHDFEKSNGDVHAHCFEKIEDKDVCLTLAEVKKIMKESMGSTTYSEKVNRSWGDCSSDEERVTIHYVDQDKMTEKLEKLKIKKLKEKSL